VRYSMRRMWRGGCAGGIGSVVHHFDGREGGSFRISPTYVAPTDPGRSTAHADAYHGSFRRHEPNEQVVEVLEFETVDEDLRGVITMTTTHADVGGRTDVFVAREWIPRGMSTVVDATGTRTALANLAVLVEANSPEAIHPWRMSRQFVGGRNRWPGPRDMLGAQWSRIVEDVDERSGPAHLFSLAQVKASCDQAPLVLLVTSGPSGSWPCIPTMPWRR